MTKLNINSPPSNLASVFRGIYARVARRLNVDPSYVSRVARGERQSEAIEAALDREMRQLMKMLSDKYKGFGRHAADRTEVKSASIGPVRTVKKRHKKVS